MTDAEQAQDKYVFVVSEQAWFKACADPKDFPPFNSKHVTSWRSRGGDQHFKVVVGRGPFKRPVFSLPVLFLDYSPYASPGFAVPNVTAGLPASVMMRRPKQEHIEFEENEVAVFMELYAIWPSANDLLAGLQKEERSGPEINEQTPIKKLVTETFSRLTESLEILIGIYTIQHFALVWEPLSRTRQLILIDPLTKQAEIQNHAFLGSIIPYQFSLGAKEAIGITGVSLEALLRAKVHLPLVFLQRALWERQAHVRFLYYFWVLEYFSELYAEGDTQMAAFIAELEPMVISKGPEASELFQKLKRDALRRPLLANLKSCFAALNIPFEQHEEDLKEAKRIRDKLVHAEHIDESRVVSAKSRIATLPPLLVQKHLEKNGVKLQDGYAEKIDIK